MKYGVINRNVTDLRAEPKFRSERKSQLLFNEPITIGKRRNGYCHVYQMDGYCGWVDERAVCFLSQRSYCRLGRDCDYQVISATARTPAIDGENSPPPFLFYGTHLQVIKKEGKWGSISGPKGNLFRILLKDLSPMPDKRGVAHPVAVIREARRFLGTPYLWGGITPFGYDCSGLVRMVYGRFGVYLPRDSKEQMKMGKWININEVQGGDLRFFKGHVAIALDRYRIIHSSLGMGGVAINSLNPADPDFRKDLIDIFLEDRRVL